MIRRLRQFFTRRATDAALALSPMLSAQAIDRLEHFGARFFARFPGLGDAVAANMRALRVYSPATHRTYFEHAARHMASTLYVLRAATTGRPADIVTMRARMAAQIELDDSLDALRDAARAGRGAVIMGPHLPNFILALPRINELAPLTIYLRHSRQRARHEAKLHWCRVTGMSWMIESADEHAPTSKLAGMVAAVRGGRTVYITPDMPRKRGDGTPARFFGRELYFPAGAMVLAARAEAPLFQLTAEPRGDRLRLLLHGPAPAARSAGERESVRAWVGEQVRWFADVFEQFVRRHPALWYSWADKRWTRVLAGDPELSAPWPAEPHPAATTPSPAPPPAATPAQAAV